MCSIKYQNSSRALQVIKLCGSLSLTRHCNFGASLLLVCITISNERAPTSCFVNASASPVSRARSLPSSPHPTLVYMLGSSLSSCNFCPCPCLFSFEELCFCWWLSDESIGCFGFGFEVIVIKLCSFVKFASKPRFSPTNRFTGSAFSNP